MKNHFINNDRKKKVWRAGLLCFLAIALCLTNACSKQNEEGSKRDSISRTDFLLDTTVTITIFDKKDETILDDGFQEIRRLEGILSVDAKGSEAEALWKNAGSQWTSVSPDTLALLKKSIYYSTLSKGSFDITTGPLISLWNIKDGKGHYPTKEELAAAKSLIGYKKILFRGENEVMLKDAGMKINFGAIAKGYIADRVKDVLMKDGVKSGIIDLGGNVLLIGEPPEGGSFRIGVQDPFGETGDIIGVLEMNDKSLVSSGSYERYFEYNGKRYHHILDPFTGFPADNDLVGVTIVTDRSVDGDALSTTAFLLGKEKGMKLIESIKDAEGIFITKDGQISTTKGLKGKLIRK